MNILFSFCNVINPHRGGTERVTHMISEFLKEQGHMIYYLCTEELDSAYTPPPHTYFLPKLESIAAKAEYIKALCLSKSIDVVINEGGVTDDVYFLSKEFLPCSVKVITCLHFDITADLKSFYSNYNYSFKGLSFGQRIQKALQIIKLPYLKHYHTHRRIKRYRYAALNSDKVVVLSPACVQKYLNFSGVLDDGKIETDWVLRIDADEYFMPGEREKLMQLLPSIKKGQNALSLSLSRYFLGRHIKHGGTGNVKMIRVFRKGIGRCEERNMDEHIVISEGEVVETNIVFADDNRNDLAWWTQKHLGYAKREAADLLDIVNEVDGSSVTIGMNNEAAMKRRTKLKYARLPLFWRAFAYFLLPLLHSSWLPRWQGRIPLALPTRLVV